MLISIENAADYKKFVEIVELVVDKDVIINSHICENNKLYAKLDDLQKEIKCLSTLNSALSEEIERIKTQQSCDEAYVVSGIAIDNLRAELKVPIEENKMLQKTVTQVEAENELLQASLDRQYTEKTKLEGIIANQERHYQELVSDYNKIKDEQNNHKQDLRYLLEIQTKLCEIIKRQYPLFDFDRWLADYEKEKVRIKKEQKRAKKHEINWKKIKEEARNERPKQ